MNDLSEQERRLERVSIAGQLIYTLIRNGEIERAEEQRACVSFSGYGRHVSLPFAYVRAER